MGISIPPLTFLTTATRHAANIDLTGTLEGNRYNERNAYRTSYDGTQRYSAGIGTALGAIAPAAAASMWLKRGASVGGLQGGGLLAGRAAAGTALAGLTVVGGLEMKKIIQDDGHLGSLGSLGGLVGGYAAGSAIGKNAVYRGVPLGALIGGAGAIAGAIGGYQGGKMINGKGWLGEKLKLGNGHIGEASANTTKTHAGVLGGAVDFSRGVATNFIETGPITQGVSLGNAWGQPAVFRDQTSKPEQAGGLVGDLGSAALMGGGALAVSKSLVGANLSKGEQVLADLSLAGHGINNASKVTDMAELVKPGSSKLGMYAVAAGVGGFVAYDQYKNYSDGGTNAGKGLLVAGGTAAAGAALGFAASRLVKGLRGNTAASAVTGALLVSSLSAIRTPVAAFLSESKSIKGTRTAASTPVQLGAYAVGGAAGALGGFKLAGRFADGLEGKWKTIALGAGTVAGAVGLGYAAHAFTPFTVKSVAAPAPATPVTPTAPSVTG